MTLGHFQASRSGSAASAAAFDELVGRQAECLRLTYHRPRSDLWTTIGRQTRVQVLEVWTEIARSVEDGVDQLVQCQQLRSLKLDNSVCLFTVRLLGVLAQLPRLDQLDLTDRVGHLLPSATVDLLARLPALKRFTLQVRLGDMPQREQVELDLLRRLVRRGRPSLTVMYNGQTVTEDPRAKAKRGCALQ